MNVETHLWDMPVTWTEIEIELKNDPGPGPEYTLESL